MSCVFIAFTLKNSSVAEFFVVMANKLSEKHKVIIFSHATEKHHLKLNPEIEVLQWPGNKPNSIKGLIFLSKLIRKFKPETIIANFSTVNIMMILGYLHGVDNRIAWYHTLSKQLEKNNVNRLRKRLFYSIATKIICNSKAAKEDIIKVFKVDPKKVYVVYNAIKKELDLSVPLKNRQIVYAGRLHPTKGVDILIRSLKIIIERIPSVSLIIIGDDEKSGELNSLKNLATRLKVNENITFVGNRSKDYVLGKFKESYCTIVPSRAESFGYVVIESFSVGTPVVATDTTGLSEIIRDGADGFLFEKENHRDLADKLITLLDNDSLRNKFSRNCRDRFIEKFEVEVVTSQFASKHI